MSALKSIFACVVVGILGCGVHYTLKNLTATGDSITQAQIHNQNAVSHIAAAGPHSDDEGRVHLTAATTQLTEQSKNLTSAWASLRKSIADYNDLKIDYDDLHAKWYCKVGRFIDTAIWIIAIVLRTGGAFGWFGALGGIAVIAGRVVLGIVTGGISWIELLFSHIEFKRKKPCPC